MQNGWQDIATAPQDGSDILISGWTFGRIGRYQAVAAWLPADECLLEFSSIAGPKTWCADEQGNPFVNVTHWMPLPENPK